MRMHVTAKNIAFLGLLEAVTVILVVLSGIFDFNTLFFLALASLGIGIAIEENGLRLGIGFYIASVMLSLLLAPNKLYCLTYSGVGLYVVVLELTRKVIGRYLITPKKQRLLILIRFLIYNMMFVPLLIWAPKLIYSGTIDWKVYVMLLLGGQVVWFVYDKFYVAFMVGYWPKLRRQLGIEK